MKGIADTGFLVAFSNRHDEDHEWAVRLAAQCTEPLLTCEPVLAETAYHLRDARIVFGLLQDRMVALAFDCNDHLLQLGEVAKRYADRRLDLADLCLIRMSELYPRHPVITLDQADFRIYRRNKREIIPIICPPQ